MKLIILTCCGEKRELPVEGGLTCPVCGTQFTQIQLEELERKENTHIPVVDLLRARAMLPTFSEATLLQEARGFGAREEPGLGLVFPLVGVFDFAKKRNSPIIPRPISDGVLWIHKT